MTTKHTDSFLHHAADLDSELGDHPEATKDVYDQDERLRHHHTYKIVGHENESDVRSYTGNISPEINSHLVDAHRRGDDPTNGPWGMYHHGIQNVFRDVAAKNPLPEDVHSYAGFSNGKLKRVAGGGIHNLKKGDEVHFPGYTSTSISPATAVSFFDAFDATDGIDRQHHIAHFHVPKGHKGALYVGTVSKHPVEQELLLNAGTKATFMGKSEHHIYKYLEAGHPHDRRLGASGEYEHLTKVHTYHFKVEPGD